MQEYNDGSGLKFINFDFVTGGRSRNQSFHSGVILNFLVAILSS